MTTPSTPLAPAVAAVVGVALLGVAGCERDPYATTLYENVGEAFAECQPSEIKHLVRKHDLMAALSYCSSNNVSHYEWNPAGDLLYFDLTQTTDIKRLSHTANLLNAETKGMSQLNIDSISGQGTWLTNTRLALPVHARMAGSTELIAVMDVVQGTLVYKMATGVREIEDLRRGATPSEILLTAKDTAGKRRLFRYDLDEGSMKPAFEWLADVVVDTFSWTPTAHVLTVGHGTTVTLYDDRTGEVKRTFEPATAGTVHPKGRFVALEHEGEEVSVFYQRSWDELPETMRKREQQRAQRMEEGLPDWYPTRVKLPTITFVDLEKDAGRWAVRTFYGTRFAWYPLEDYYGSFLLWGIEGKQLNRNVMLGDMTLNLFRMERGKESREFRRLGSDGSPPAEAAGPEEPAAKLEK